jgi:hypothetical protein
MATDFLQDILDKKKPTLNIPAIVYNASNDAYRTMFQKGDRALPFSDLITAGREIVFGSSATAYNHYYDLARGLVRARIEGLATVIALEDSGAVAPHDLERQQVDLLSALLDWGTLAQGGEFSPSGKAKSLKAHEQLADSWSSCVDVDPSKAFSEDGKSKKMLAAIEAAIRESVKAQQKLPEVKAVGGYLS